MLLQGAARTVPLSPPFFTPHGRHSQRFPSAPAKRIGAEPVSAAHGGPLPQGPRGCERGVRRQGALCARRLRDARGSAALLRPAEGTAVLVCCRAGWFGTERILNTPVEEVLQTREGIAPRGNSLALPPPCQEQYVKPSEAPRAPQISQTAEVPQPCCSPCSHPQCNQCRHPTALQQCFLIPSM